MTLDTNRTSGETGHLTDHNTLHAEYNGQHTDQQVRYVATYGSDSSDGLSWGTPFLTIAAAVDSLPVTGTGGQARHAGIVEVGEGVFTETSLPLELNAEITYRGRGPIGGDRAGGTTVKAGANADLFAPTGAFTDVAHYTRIEDMAVDGSGVTGAFDLVKIRKGGFNSHIRNVYFDNSARYGLHVQINAVDLHVENCTWAQSRNHDIFFSAESTPSLLQITHAQADNGEGSFLRVEHVSDGQGHLIVINGLKTEADSAGDYDNVIVSRPRTAAGGNPMLWHIANVAAAHNGGGGSNVVYEETETGVASEFILMNVNGQSYTKAFKSDKSVIASSGARVIMGMTDSVETFA